MGAVAIALELGCSIDDINIGLVRFSPPENRSRIEMLPNGATVLIDLYNANPSSMRAALETIGQIAQKRNSSQIVLCLGDMLELGVDELSLHEQLAIHFPSSPNCYAFLYGDRMKALAEVLRSSYPHVKTQHFSDMALMAIAVKASLSTGTLMLIKGSRGMALEKLWNFLENLGR
jgi:UDP-N-acetylmuramoyl-tripeptide--D-alanyl-D-alanine ligase